MSPKMTLAKFLLGTFTESAIQRLARNIIRLTKSQVAKNIYIYLNYLIVVVKIAGLTYFVWKWVKRILASRSKRNIKRERKPDMIRKKIWELKGYGNQQRLPVIQEEEQVDDDGEEEILLMLISKSM